MSKKLIFFFTIIIFNCYSQFDLKKMISNCENDSVCFYIFTNNSWITQSRYINFTYSSDSTLFSNEYQNLNYGVWLNQSKNILQIDNVLKTTTEINKKWNGSIWIDSIKTIIYYNSIGKDTLSILSSYNNNIWENKLKYSYKYNANYNLTEVIQYDWDGFTWIIKTKMSNEYDSIENLLSNKNYNWFNNNWTLQNQTSYTYNTFNKLILEIYESLSSFSNDNYKNEYTYTNDKLSMKINYSYLQNNWMPTTKTIYGYDINGIKQNEYIYLKNNTNDTWDIEYNTDFEFINFDTIEHIKHWNGITWIIEKDNKYLYQDSSCINGFEFIYYDSTGTNVKYKEKILWYPRNQLKKNNIENDITIFPNPSTGQFNISSINSINSIYLLDAYGNITFHYSPNENTKNYIIETSNYKAGIYFLKINFQDGLNTIKKIEINN